MYFLLQNEIILIRKDVSFFLGRSVENKNIHFIILRCLRAVPVLVFVLVFWGFFFQTEPTLKSQVTFRNYCLLTGWTYK